MSPKSPLTVSSKRKYTRRKNPPSESRSYLTENASKAGTALIDPKSLKKNPPKCLITGSYNIENPLHRCHMLSRRHWLNHPKLSRLEWAWGMDYNTISLNKDSNTFMLCREWRDLLESGRWTLFPSLKILDKFWKRWKGIDLNGSFSVPSIYDIYDDDEDTFEYRLIPLFDDLPVIQHRRTDDEELPIANPGDAKSFAYPYDTLPPIISRVRPHFVICHAGQMLCELVTRRPAIIQSVCRIYDLPKAKVRLAMNTIIQSYKTWSYQSPPVSFVSSPRSSPWTFPEQHWQLLSHGDDIPSSTYSPYRPNKRRRTCSNSSGSDACDGRELQSLCAGPKYADCALSAEQVDAIQMNVQNSLITTGPAFERGSKVFTGRWSLHCAAMPGYQGGVPCVNDEQIGQYSGKLDRRVRRKI